MMNHPTPGTSPSVACGLAALAVLTTSAGCASDQSPPGGTRPLKANTVQVDPDYTDSPGPHPTKIVVQADSPISATATTITQNGPDSIVVKFAPQGPFVPTASVSPHP